MNNGELRLNMGSAANLPNTTDAGDLYVAEDVAELYVDTFDHGRVRISDVFSVATIVARDSINAPLSGKYYYVRETNTFYTYYNSAWHAVGDGVFTNSSATVKADEMKNNFIISLSGDASGSVTTKCTGTGTINVTLASSGVVSGTYGETVDKNLVGSSTISIPKITVDSKGRITAVNAVTVTMPASMGINRAILTNSGSSTTAANAATNGNVFINTIKDGSVVDAINFTGRGATSVTLETDSIVINSANDNTTYAATGGIQRVAADANASEDYVFQHSNSITAGNVAGSSGAIAFGGSISIPKITYDAQGHITGTETTTVTLPATPTDKDVATSVAATTKAYVTGTSSSTGGNGALVFDTDIYLDTTAGTLHATSFDGDLTGTAAKATADASGNTITTTYAPLASPALTGTPTAPTASVGTNTTQIATTAFVAAAISAMGDVLTFKGTLGTGGTITALPTTYNKGDEYKIVTAGTYAGNVCEVGDLIIAIETRAGTNTANSDWAVVQGNIDGAVTSVDSTTTGQITVTKPNASTIRVNHADSGATAGAYGTSGKVAKVTVNSTGHVTAIEEVDIVYPTYTANGGISLSNGNFSHSNSITAGTVSPTTGTVTSTVNIPSISYDANGHITGATPNNVTMDFGRIKTGTTEPSSSLTVGMVWMNFDLTVPAP